MRDETPAALAIDRVNTILYCTRWSASVAFYRTVVGLDTTFVNDWFIEFGLGDGSYLSIADTAHASIESSGGAGLTLSWHVADIDTSHQLLHQRGAMPGEIHTRWGARAFHIYDPEGHRIECWTAPAGDV